jgi:hypothetical protein
VVTLAKLKIARSVFMSVMQRSSACQHTVLSKAAAAVLAGADYIGVGSNFSTTTKGVVHSKELTQWTQ